MRNWWDKVIFPLTFFTRAAILLPGLLYTTLLWILTTKWFDCIFDALAHETIGWSMCAIGWLLHIMEIFFSTLFGRVLWNLLMILFYLLFCGPIALYSFFKSVYNFGPDHRKRSLISILLEPVPPEEHYHTPDDGKGRTYHSANVIPRKVLRNRRLNSKDDFNRRKRTISQRRIVQRDFSRYKAHCKELEGCCMVQRQYQCPNNHITPLSAKSGIYSMYTTSDAANLGFGNMDASHEMAMTLYFAITSFSHPKFIWMPLPKRPPDGMILSTVMLAIISSIFGCYVFRFYGYVTSRVILHNIRRGVRLAKPSQLHLSSIMRELLRRVNKSFSWCDIPLP